MLNVTGIELCHLRGADKPKVQLQNLKETQGECDNIQEPKTGGQF